MKIAIVGGSGLIGSAVKQQAEQEGHEVTVLHVPRPPKAEAHHAAAWNKALEEWTPKTFSGYDCLMFFGGESIMNRWTDNKRQRIELSRQLPCRRMAECAAAAPEKPRIIVTASAIGIYGERGEEALTEESAPGKGFLAATTVTWERTWEAARQAGIAVVCLRIGVVLTPKGGALKLMLPAFKAGVGGPLAGGQQWQSWIALPDMARLALYCADNPDLAGPVNAVAPNPVKQREFAAILGAVLHRPAVLPVPRPALRLIFGEMAKETILLSTKVLPQRAVEHGFHFLYPELRAALQHLLHSREA